MKKLWGKISHITEKPLTMWDYTAFAFLAAICFVCFVQTDIMHTVGCSVGYLNGHILDFYDYCGANGIHPSYMPTVYMLFAVWSIPAKIFGFLPVPTDQVNAVATLWAKLLPCLAFAASGYLVYLICREIGMGSKKSKLCVYATLTMPIAFYSQFIFGQYDIFMTACVLLGFYYYLKDRHLPFVLWFAVAITFKYTALLIFIPLLLLKHKDIWKIVKSLILVAVPLGIEFLIYRGSPGFANYAFGIGGSGDTPTDYIFNAGIFTGFELSANQYSVSLVILLFGVICAWAYFTHVKEKRDLINWSLYLTCLVFFAFFGLSKWHPQWLMLAVPFWVISAFTNRNTKIFLVIDIIFMLLYTIFNVTMIPNNVDQAMWNNGIFKLLINRNIGTELTMGQIMGVIDPVMCVSMISMIMLVYALFKHPKYCADRFDAPVGDTMGWMRARLLIGVGIFLIPACMSFAAYFTSPNPAYQVGAVGAEGRVLCGEDEIVQKAAVRGESLEKLQFYVVVNDLINEGSLTVSVRDPETKTVMYTETMDTGSWYDFELISCSTGGIAAPEDGWYEVVFTAEPDVDEKDYQLELCYIEGNPTQNAGETLTVDGVPEDGQISMVLYEK